MTYTADGLDGAVHHAVGDRDEWGVDVAREVAAEDLDERGAGVGAAEVDVLDIRDPDVVEVA
ncbi:hypothetical protein DJ71_20470 [Halorubrum sp. E3]|nr:hypothetical protein DJ71_20470 [Halorubrum sp. E3]